MPTDFATSALTALAVAAAVPVALAAWLHINSRRPRIKGLPYPPPKPIMGNSWDILSDLDHRFDTFTNWFKQLGSTFTLLPMSLTRSPVLVTADPAIVEHILKTNFENYVKGERFHELLGPLLGDGIFATDGSQWKWQRKVSSHIFTGKNFREVVERVIFEEMEKFLGVLSAAADSGEQIDVHSLLHCLTMDSFGRIGFGHHINTLDDPKNVPIFVRCFDQVSPILNMRFPNEFYWLTEAITGDAAKVRNGIRVIEEVVYAQIRAKREEMAAEGATKTRSHRDLLDLFMAYDAEITDRQLRDMVLNMILAGRDTTAEALAWAFWILSSRPDVVEKMREEIDRTVGDALPTYEEVPTLKYITAVFYETLRLYPSVPVNFKMSVKEDVLPGGIHIPAGTEVNWSPYCMARLTKNWGEDAEEFRPERWFDENGNIKRESPFKWAAFNAGPRVCLGQQMATVEAVIALVGIVRRFDFKLTKDADVRPGLSITLAMAKGMPMTVERVKA
ncbi:hypothetical protein HDU96_010009 [Phlyctochytrium bullatum]|nr:hypothetical protein HDU96_010009 [Phlyctochytrium bullatum]